MKHPIPAFYRENAHILILGSFPSVKSREQGFFYGHPRNRFWAVLAGVFGTDTPETVSAKKQLLSDNRLALWDVIASCEVEGSADSSIREVIPNDIRSILQGAPIEKIFTNGKTADRLYRQLLYPVTGAEAICLPSTSPANASWSLERLTAFWKERLLS